jgi:hypothetical protein
VVGGIGEEVLSTLACANFKCLEQARLVLGGYLAASALTLIDR